MTKFLNSFDTGTNGTTVTASNSGGGSNTAFTAATTGVSFTNAQTAHGALGATASPAAAVQYVRWNLAGESVAAARIYVKLPAAITADIYPLVFGDTTGSGQATARIVSNGLLRIMGPSTTTLWTGTQQVPVNSWVRIEMYANQSTNQYRIAMYALDSTTAIDDSGLVTGAAGCVGTSGFTQIRFGVGNASFTGTIYFDELALNSSADATGLVGPWVPQPPAVTLAASPSGTVEPGTTVTLTATPSLGSGTYSSYSFSQTSGTTVTLSGTGATRTYTAPLSLNGETDGFSVTVTDSNSLTSSPGTASSSVLPAPVRVVIAGRQMIPARRLVVS